MVRNDQIILEKTLEQQRKSIAEELTEDKYFEIFAFEQLLKNYELSYEELNYGKVDGTNDGGIDGFFTFMNGELVNEDTDFSNIKRKPQIEVFIIQAKNKGSYTETALDHIIATIADIFDLNKEIGDLENLYSDKLVDMVANFRRAYLELASKHPELNIEFFYATKGDNTKVNSKVNNRGATLVAKTKELFHGADVTNSFVGARELVDASRVEKTYTLQLNFIENYISTAKNNYIVLAKLNEYYDFVTDDAGNLRRYIFDSNVRDYQGEVEVNKSIRQTLESPSELDFWWLNNGISIIASKATIAGKTINLENVQVVNGLQTTQTIYDYLKTAAERTEVRTILVRIIVTENPEANDKIIKATNFQTYVNPASFKATDRIQRDIEAFFKHYGLFYDRRKNYYKNLNKPLAKIISIPYLAQALMAILLAEPDNARARPTTLIKDETDYARVFDVTLDLVVFVFCVNVMKTVEFFIKGHSNNIPYEALRNLRFHLAMVAMMELFSKKSYGRDDLRLESLDKLNIALLEKALGKLYPLVKSYGALKKEPIDKLVKSRDFVKYVKKNYIVRKSRTRS